MSDWLERELVRGLAPVAAPHTLRVRLGFAPARRWELPRLMLAVAAAVLLVIGGGYAANRTATYDLDREAGVDLTQSGGAHLPRCDGGAGMRSQMNAGNATVLLAHESAPAVGTPSTVDAGCHLCHTL